MNITVCDCGTPMQDDQLICLKCNSINKFAISPKVSYICNVNKVRSLGKFSSNGTKGNHNGKRIERVRKILS
jgi:hypothetical protein